MYSHLILLTIVKGKDDLHCKAALLQTAVFLLAGGVILNGNRHFFVALCIGLHSGTISCFIQDGHAAIILIAQIPFAAGNGENRISKLCFHRVYTSFCNKAIAATGQRKSTHINGLSVLLDGQALQVLSCSRCDGQGNRLTDLVSFLIRSNRAVCGLSDA